MTTKQAVAFVRRNFENRAYCTECGAQYSWRSVYFMLRHVEQHGRDAAWRKERTNG